ncbi:hypothetical protein N7491_010957 [Penicillium cf. griseofulvum]|uniref:Uncharacterized protein n=1 Tax=Penicillium cf. griseofulvum TaxID=2972120 RepID=A0A9W9N0W2_9EURO|nr:hypothetical protein N7472_001276 [Penicillium cf. griseofulvum]KAJ5422512.1 hypothetical protein N7491_010957 [Penicillium cf. griseofulvum]
MPKYALHTAYQWYCTLKSTNDPNLELPPLNAPDTPATSTNNLRKHYADKHVDITLAARGGRPSLQDENDAVEFYVAIRDEYDANVDQAASIKPAIPRKADGTIHLTNMRKLAKERGGQIPCEPCKDAEDHPGCCREENAERCDNFELFLTGGGEE